MMKKIFTFLLVLLSLQSFSQSTTLVISQLYGGGGNSGAPYNADFLELHNVSAVAQSTAGLSVQYASSGATGVWTGVFALPTASIPAGGYYLIRMSVTGATGVALPTPDAAPTAGSEIAMSATNGRVALVNGITALTGCPTANVIDLVGFGTSVCFENTATPALSNTTAALRNNNGCTDTDNNSSDFTVGAPAPRNSAAAVLTCGAASPNLTATTLTAFGGVCINTTAGPNSFTITGSALTAANVTVGALAGFTYSTTAGGTYTSTLSLTQPGGAYAQDIFVQFTPTAIQSYHGNITVGGGGATAINVAASGAGINAPALTTGAATAVTQVSATLEGTISSTGCTAVTAYGIEYSTTMNFPNGTGTAVPSTNLSAGTFTSGISGLTANTTYYYHAYATNGGGTGYGSEQSFTTSAASVPGMVISQVYGGGGNASATYNQDFVELFNRSNATIDISGWSVQYGSATGPGGTGDWAVAAIPATTTVAPGKYYLVALATGATGIALPTADLINTTINMSGTAGKVALVNDAVALNGTTACNSATVADVLGYGTTATCSETAPFNTTGIDNTKASFRKSDGCIDANNNSTDFEVLSVLPRNSATAANICGAASPTLSATALTAFGNVCINTTAGPNSFTITGTALTNADVTVAALAGFTYSTTAGGTYTGSLSLTQPGGAYSQQIFVQFMPTAVQTYSGNIPIGGAGATAINVAAAGSGVNTMPTVTTGAASVITTTSATLAGSIPANGCTAVTAYGIEYSITNGFPNGTGTQVASTNLSAGNFSSGLTGLTPGITYYYKAYATNAGGTAYGAQQSFTTIALTPVITVTALSTFGSVCINTVAGPNSFTINGTNLSTADILVGPLAGFSFSTTAAGTYTASLTLIQPGGNYSQQVFVNFSPVAVQSYNGNIPVTGAGAPPVSAAATGSGINTVPSVTSAAASAVTQSSATVSGTIPAIGCSAITAYGIEFSTTNGFPNGTGTTVASSNLSGINFSSALTGLTPGSIYYYHAYATNAGGTSYGAQGSFTTSAPVLTATPLTSFGANCINTTAGPNSFVINSTAVTAANINVGPLNAYTFSTTAAGTYTASLSLAHAAGPFTQTVYVKFTPTAVQSYNGNIPVSGGGAATINVVTSGNGSNTAATVVSGNATVLSANAVMLNGTVSSTGCSPVTGYGIEYSGISGLANGLGTKVPSANLSSGNFSATLNGLVQGATYYYKAYATNSAGINYGTQQSFTTTSIPSGFVIYSSPVQRNSNLHYTYNDIKPGHYQIQIFNSVGQLVFQKALITQLNFIDDNFIVPGKLGTGVYSLQIASPDFRDKKIFMIW